MYGSLLQFPPVRGKKEKKEELLKHFFLSVKDAVPHLYSSLLPVQQKEYSFSCCLLHFAKQHELRSSSAKTCAFTLFYLQEVCVSKVNSTYFLYREKKTL